MLDEDFFSQFKSEDDCKAHLKACREAQGIVCKTCSGSNHFWLANEEKWQCYGCKSRTNLTAGTLMHRSKLSLYTWYRCLHYMTSDTVIAKSARQITFKLRRENVSYSAVWLMMHKIRVSMGKRDRKYELKGPIEIDDAKFEVVMFTTKKDELGNSYKIDKNGDLYEPPIHEKRGRGTQSKRDVMVMVESTPTANKNPNKKDRKMGYVKLVAMDDMTSDSIEVEVKSGIHKYSTAITDKYPSYNVLDKLIAGHDPMVVKGKDAMKKLPWVHTVIANSKRKFLGVYHSINDKYLQNYLNEFAYKLNRRDFKRDSFEGMFKVALSGIWCD